MSPASTHPEGTSAHQNTAEHPEKTTIDDVHSDPYKLTKDKIKEPPTGFKDSIKFLGPGMITSAAVVGSGELITATTLGSRVGMMLLWLILVSTFVKVFVQVEIARWSISTGKPAIFGYDEVKPKIAGRGWPSYIVLLMFFQYTTSQAGVIGAAGVAMSMLIPLASGPTDPLSIAIWVWVMAVLAIIIHMANRYDVIENISTTLVFVVTILIIGMVFAIQFTEFAWTASELAEGMRFQIAAGSMGIALSMFGLTGVGAGEISGYSFWVVEKGYAAWTGPNDGSEAWVKRARGWISVMKKDAWISWVIYTMSTMAFYILGATVLYKQNLVVDGTDLVGTIARIFTDTLGGWVGPVFLVFAALTLYKTILANVPSLARSTAASLSVFRLFVWTDQKKRDRVMRILMIVFPIFWAGAVTVFQSPFFLVMLGGTLNAVYLIIVAISTLYLSATQTDKRIKDGVGFTIFLVISAIAILGVGVVGLADMF
ncbi:Nramp family divalent metal transporter [Corynebacterium cystitidis]|uniref:Nramp family divalent metal transporter n=1 Tax=Corynebacterium cystitidis TaxID=35757 RepID=UPI00211E4FD3|nr:Nramp family divalent metal transporter [Corynebacterium cystitidis]